MNISTSTMKDLITLLPEGLVATLPENFFPFAKRGFVEQIQSEGTTAIFSAMKGSKIADYLWNLDQDVTLNPQVATRGVRNPDTGEIEKNIPVRMLRGKADEKSYDIEKVMKMFAAMSVSYDYKSQIEDKIFLTAAATDSHRMSISKIRLQNKVQFDQIILPKKTIFQLCSLLEDYEGEVKISNIKSKIKFQINNSILISKLIDGKFPNYVQVIPKENQKKLEVDLKSFLNSVDRVASVSLDKKDGVKFNLSKDNLDLSVNNTNSGDGKESLSVKFDHELDISFNSRYLIDVASQLDGDHIEIYLKDTGSPALIRDPADYDSIYVVMPMKG